MDSSIVLILLLFVAVMLSIISLIIATVSFFRTNKKLKGLLKSFKLFAIRTFVEKGMKRENQYENFDSFLGDKIDSKSKIEKGT